MNRGVWVASVALGLGGLLSGVAAQELTWRPLPRPRDDRPVQTAPRPAQAGSPGVVMGRPVPILRASSGVLSPSPRPFPAALREDARVIGAPVAGTAQAIAAFAPPGAVIAASAGPDNSPPAPVHSPGEAPEQLPDLFAADRAEPPVVAAPPIGAPPVGPAPVAAPPVATVVAEPRLVPEPQTAEPRPVRDLLRVADWSGKFPTLDSSTQAKGATCEAGEAAPVSCSRCYLRAEYLLWWTKADHAPPLVTTGDPRLANREIVGALGNPDTGALQNGNLTSNPFSGGRFTAGYFLDDCCCKAIEISGFFLGPRAANFQVAPGVFPVVTRPFFAVNPELNMESVQQNSFPNSFSGSLAIHAPSQLWGLEANFLCPCCCGCDYRVDVLAGPRYLNLREGLTITESLLWLANSPIPGAFQTVFDSFGTKNQFYGAQVGVAGRWYYERLSVDGIAKLALGITHQEVDVNGSQSLTLPNGTIQRSLGGLLALDSNIGHRSRDRFSVVPEVGVRLGYAVASWLRLTVGYNFLYWSSVARPGEQIDRGLDVTRIPNFLVNGQATLPSGMTVTPTPVNPPRPAPLFNSTDYWAQGLTFGIELTF